MRHVPKVLGDIKYVTCGRLLVLWEATSQVLQQPQNVLNVSSRCCACGGRTFQAAAPYNEIFSLINYPRNEVVTVAITGGPCAGLIARQIVG
jgi:hypothetical protein